MKLIKTDFKDLIIIKHSVFLDHRGQFKETFRKKELEKNIGYKLNFCQENVVVSKFKSIRGLHFQNEPYSQSKLISIVEGKILDVAVDIRKNSKTYGKYFSYIISSDSHESLFIPKGFAHGYLTLSKRAILTYKVDNYYNKEMECGIAYNDKNLKIDWGIEERELKISLKDKNLKPYKW